MIDGVAEIITAKRDVLLVEQATLIKQREELLTRMRKVERELADCRATARFHGLDSLSPKDSHDD